MDEADEEDLSAGLSFSLRERFDLTGSNIYALATHLLDKGVRSVEQFEALRTEYVSTLGFSSSDEGKIVAAKQALAEAQALAAAQGSALTPAQEKMLEEAYDRKDGGVRFQVCGCLLLAPTSHTWLADASIVCAVARIDAVASRAQSARSTYQCPGQGVARSSSGQSSCCGARVAACRENGHAEWEVRGSKACRQEAQV